MYSALGPLGLDPCKGDNCVPPCLLGCSSATLSSSFFSQMLGEMRNYI